MCVIKCFHYKHTLLAYLEFFNTISATEFLKTNWNVFQGHLEGKILGLCIFSSKQTTHWNKFVFQNHQISSLYYSSDFGLWSRRSGLSDPEVKNLTLTGNLVYFCVSINVSPYKQTLLAYLKKKFHIIWATKFFEKNLNIFQGHLEGKILGLYIFSSKQTTIEINVSFRITGFQVSSDCGLCSRKSGLYDTEVKIWPWEVT